MKGLGGLSLAQRVAVVALIVFAVLTAWAAFVPAQSDGDSCGTWLAPHLSDERVAATLKDADNAESRAEGLGIDTSNLRAMERALVAEKRDCDSKLGTRETLTWVFGAGLLVVPLAVLIIGGGLSRRASDLEA